MLPALVPRARIMRFAKGSIEALLLLKPSHCPRKPTDAPSPFNNTLQEDAHRLIEMTDHELHILSISTAQVAKVLVTLVIAYDLMIGHEDQIAVHLPVLVERSTHQLKEEARDQ